MDLHLDVLERLTVEYALRGYERMLLELIKSESVLDNSEFKIQRSKDELIRVRSILSQFNL